MLTYRNAVRGDLPFIIGLIVEDSVVSTNDDPADASHPDYTGALAAIDADPNQEMIVARRAASPWAVSSSPICPDLCAAACGAA